MPKSSQNIYFLLALQTDLLLTPATSTSIKPLVFPLYLPSLYFVENAIIQSNCIFLRKLKIFFLTLSTQFIKNFRPCVTSSRVKAQEGHGNIVLQSQAPLPAYCSCVSALVASTWHVTHKKSELQDFTIAQHLIVTCN